MDVVKSIQFIYLWLRCVILSIIVGTRCLYYDYTMKKSNRVTLKSLPGKVAVITGGNRGIGREVTKMLLNCDMTVILGTRRNLEHTFVEELSKEGVKIEKLLIYELDTSSLESVKTFASTIVQRFNKVNYLINNAGVSNSKNRYSTDGLEVVFATNYLGHFYLTHLLLPLLKNGGTEAEYSRAINVISCTYTVGEIKFSDINRSEVYFAPDVYAQSKLAMILFSNYLNQLLVEENSFVQFLAVDPGAVNTEIFKGTFMHTLLWWYVDLLFKNPKAGAIPIVYACIEEVLQERGGILILNGRIVEQTLSARDIELQRKLYNFSRNLIIKHCDTGFTEYYTG